MMNVIAILLAALCLQEAKTIVRAEKGDYTAAVAKCREAQGMIESDPQGAIEKLTEVINLPKVRKIECTVRIEERPAELSDPYDFLPYQYRGLARMNLAKKAQPEPAQKLLAGAVEDFQESVKRNVAPSAALLKDAQARLDKLKADLTKPPDPVKDDPVARFREKWEPLLRENRFKAAKAVVDKDGAGLSEDQKKGFTQSTEQLCRDFLVKQVAEFRPRFINAMGVGLDQKPLDEFELAFALPAPEELVVSHPAIDWARQYLPAFRDVQSQKAPASSLAAAAAAAAPLEDRFENPWFKAAEAAVFQSLRSSIAAEVDKSRDAAKADRDAARSRADALHAQWKAFTAKLDPKFVERHRFLPDHDGQLAKLFEGFPADLAEIEKIDPGIEAAFAAESPESELARIEESLAGLESRPNMTRESRQKLYTARVTVAALRGLFTGKSEEAVAGELSSYRAKLREAGGPSDAKKFGPRVEKVFAALK
jgi:hypothetical protein